MTNIVMTTTMPDILYDDLYRLEPAAVMPQLAAFGLTPEQLTTLLQTPTCMLAGGAAANIFYNYLHLGEQKPMDPHTDLDFWIYDPHLDVSHSAIRYEAYTVFNTILKSAGYVQHNRHPAIAVWYSKAFQAQGDTKIRCNWWVHPEKGKRIQLIFTSTPPDKTLLNFDLPVCRVALTAHNGSFYLQWTGQCEKVMRDRVMTVPPVDNQTPLLAYRVAKYAERYDIKILHYMT